LVILLALAGQTAAIANAQDFDPKGRKRGKPGTTKPSGTGKPTSPQPAGATPKVTPTPGSTQPAGADPTAPKSASSTVLIERYTRVVLAQPGSPFPLQRLAQLYRDRDGNIAGLIKDFETRAAADSDAYAATVTIGGIYKIDGRGDDAIKAYDKAIVLKPKEPAALLAVARLLQDRADLNGAKTRYEQALEVQALPSDREQTIRSLVTLLFDSKDYDGAKIYHDKLVVLAKGSLFVRGEFARELLARGEFSRAETEYAALMPLAQGDNRVLAPLLKDLGRAQVKAGKSAEALATLQRALATAGKEAGVRNEVYELIAEVHRKEQTLGTLVAELEKEGANDFQRLQLLGHLYEETGDGTKALATYKKALALNPKHLDLRLKVVRILQSQGEIDKAITEYESLVRAAPNNPTFVFELAEAILQRGDRARALRLLVEVEARSGSDEEILSRLADFYGRIGENDKSVATLTRLSQLNVNDPSHIVDLGSRYFQDGKVPLAIQTWKRILTVVAPRARALSALADVYLEHEMTDEATTLLKEAITLDKENAVFKKQLASAYERNKLFAESRTLWEQVAKKAKDSDDRVLAREARSRLVMLWGLEKTLPAQVPILRAKFSATPPDLEAGRMLAEVELRLRHLNEAEAAMRRVIELAPSDTETYLALERTLVQNNKIAEAIAVLEKLIAADPKRARETYQRMAQYALQIYKDDDAVQYAARAVELNPEDAEGHRRLGDMYRSRQDRERAISEYRAAITKNDRLFLVYFQLADLLLAKSETTEADALFRKVMRSAPDDELVSQAARMSMQVHLGKGTLEELERDLLPLTVGNPTRPVFRRVLVDLYGSLTYRLVKRAELPGPDGAEAVRKLGEIGARAVKPLLDALADNDVGQQRIAIDVLSHVPTKNTGLSLFAYANGAAESSLRARAMFACASLRDGTMLPKYEALLFPKDVETLALGAPSDHVGLGAVYAIAKLKSPRAIPVLRRVLRDGTPEMQTLAALGLGALRDKGAKDELLLAVKTRSKGALVRAASIIGLAQQGAEEAPALALELSQTGRLVTRRSAVLALGILAPKTAKFAEPVSANLFLPSDGAFESQDHASETARATVRVLIAMSEGTAMVMDAVPDYDGVKSVESYIFSIAGSDAPTKAQRTRVVVQYEAAILKAALEAARGSSDRASKVVDAFALRKGAFLPFMTEAEAASDPGAKSAALRMADQLEETLIPVARNPDVALRARVLSFLAAGTSEASARAIKQALADSDEAIVRTALSAITTAAGPAKVESDVIEIALKNTNWTLRSLALEALGAMTPHGGSGAAASKVPAQRTFESIAEHDAYAVVRERALRELVRLDSKAAKQVASRLAKSDAEPHLRTFAAQVAAAP
jgi:cellulose synthase operon protein C